MPNTTDGELDEVDLAILDLLADDGRRSFADIGAEVGLSTSAAKRRVDRLEARGVIVRFTAVLDQAKLGRPVQAFTELRFEGRTKVDEIANVASDIPEVQAVFTVAGDPDALVLVRSRDVDDLKRIIDELRTKEHVLGTRTMMILDTYRNLRLIN